MVSAPGDVGAAGPAGGRRRSGHGTGTVRVSLVTVCLNQAESIERAICSVLEQAGEPVEYIIIDGGSTDGTREIIERHADRLAYWVSESDRGQSHALNKGFAHATGDVLGWLNADDVLTPRTIQTVREVFEGGAYDVVCGACRYEYPDGRVRVQGIPAREFRQLMVYDPIHQPSCFWRRCLHEGVGGLNETLNYGMDWDLWLRFARAGASFAVTDKVLSVYRMTGVNKTATGGARRNREMYDILRLHGRGMDRVMTEIAYRVLWPLKRLRGARPQWLCRRVSDLARTTCALALGPVFGFDRVRRSTHPFS